MDVSSRVQRLLLLVLLQVFVRVVDAVGGPASAVRETLLSDPSSMNNLNVYRVVDFNESMIETSAFIVAVHVSCLAVVVEKNAVTVCTTETAEAILNDSLVQPVEATVPTVVLLSRSLVR